ncbi:hypothetical protein OVA26_16105 [Microbacterium sp. SL62]|uniref:hypothetical protein n=1 Tax=Microbacterium sp. SL62 TaxID=2995139 RepID=UPI002274156D|nr:hypothetical protein [Microbacterium sp. SL62]MCY1718459.1 hypothetical protein [Microbacterium sp. SL62]
MTLSPNEGKIRVASTYLTTTGMTQLAKRLSPLARPSFPWFAHFIGWTLGITAFAGLVATLSSNEPYMFVVGGFFAIFVAWIPAAVITYVVGKVRARVWRERQGEWDASNERLQAAYFCARDDVIVNEHEAQRPEDFIAELFRPAAA